MPAGARSFVVSHVSTWRSGQGHHQKGVPPLNAAQRFIMACSSLLYLGSAAAWLSYGFYVLGAWFCAVSILSVCADSLSGLLPESLMQYARIADRTVGTIGLCAAVVCNSTTVVNAMLSGAAVVTSLCWFVAGRTVAKADPTARGKYLFFHGMWHAWGAAALVAITYTAQSHRV
jgi:hypothetical protein